MIFAAGDWPADVINVGDPTLGLAAKATLQGNGGVTHVTATAVGISGGCQLNVNLATGSTLKIGA